MNWQRGTRKCTAKVYKMSTSSLHSWHPKDTSTNWLDKLGDRAARGFATALSLFRRIGMTENSMII